LELNASAKLALLTSELPEAAHLEARLRREQHYGKERETTFGEAALLYIEAKKRDRKPVCSPQYL
jgi:hypothetical protein